MAELSDALLLLVQRMSDHDLLDAGWNARISERMIFNLGECDFLKKTITLSKIYIMTNNLKHIEYTILHEIAHALLRRGGHGDDFVEMAKSIGVPRDHLGPKAKAGKP
jgi:predicted SprT family Zn-dependent metalloprotease